MAFELNFFSACNHRAKSEPLIIDEMGIGYTNAPIVNSDIRVLAENCEVHREPVVRSDDDVDTLAGPFVTHIDLVTQEVLHKGCVEIRKYRRHRDYILTSDRLILWLDSATLKPNPGELYFVSYRTAAVLPDNFRILDAQRIKLTKFDRNKTYVVDYTTREEFCTKCLQQGGVENGIEVPGVMQDIVYGATGDLVRVEGVQKLKEEMIRAVLMVRGSNPRELSFGTTIESSIGTAQPSALFESLLAQDVRRSLELLKTLHRIQRNVQNLDDSEVLEQIVEVRLQKDRSYPRNNLGERPFRPDAHQLFVAVQTRANTLEDFFVPLDVFTKNTDPSDLPIISVSNVDISNISRDQATVTWTSNIPTDTILDWGETDDLSSRSTGEFGKTHFIALAGLKPDTLYYLKVVTINRAFVFGAALRTFKTLA